MPPWVAADELLAGARPLTKRWCAKWRRMKIPIGVGKSACHLAQNEACASAWWVYSGIWTTEMSFGSPLTTFLEIVMQIVIGDSQNPTSIDTALRCAAIAPDKGDKLVVVLGINRVEIEHIDGSWTISHGANVISRALSQTDPKAFSPLDQKLTDANP